MAHFIATESLGGAGLASEARVWKAVREAWSDRDAFVYWRFPSFEGQQFREPDILIADRELGLIIIEVKAYLPDHVQAIHGHRWTVAGFSHGTQPYEQARRQLQVLLDGLEADPALSRRVPGKAVVALPMIRRAEWKARRFDQLPSAPPIIFADDLSPAALLRCVQEAARISSAPPMSPGTWKALTSWLGMGPVTVPPGAEETGPPSQKASVMARVRAHRHALDLQQEMIAKTLPPGPQRIRGIAGSGKTILLAQKAAAMHLKRPDWTIIVTYFNRSLSQLMERQVDRWLRQFSHGKVTLESTQGRVKVMAAWGTARQPGLYRTVARAHQLQPRKPQDYPNAPPGDAFAFASRDLLLDLEKAGGIQPLFDAVLIDESQDLVTTDATGHYRGRQPFFWLAYQAIRPDPETGHRRLIWAYDEGQSLHSTVIPTASELFGQEHTSLVQGTYEGGIRKSEIMHRCYRTPGEILTAAHAIGMGLLRTQGMLTGLTTRKNWEAIGYAVEGQFTPGQRVTVSRPAENSPHPIRDYVSSPLLHFEMHPSRTAELDALMQALQRNINYDGLAPSRQIMVVVLGSGRKTQSLTHRVLRAMTERQLDYYLPGQRQANDTSATDWRVQDRNKFWHDNAITVTTIHRAKGNEADVVHVIGFDLIAEQEDQIPARNQLFTAMTRARGWLRVSGTELTRSALTEEFTQVIEARGTFTFTFKRPRRNLDEVQGPEPDRSKALPSWVTDWV